ncbi:hypothetical protein Q760_00065 [Cellulomonas cellasea DSM 20118]|uniref:Uncharacterized protein n=1 Tax=Cellulomonas cellasea DSM 20118 TaxID=1408250 RepID=A0A0A0BAZ3_9CELL|nr:hypothetical protein Q760_00065 [Cellulomonas cellasea DSM 20118]
MVGVGVAVGLDGLTDVGVGEGSASASPGEHDASALADSRHTSASETRAVLDR